ncbi:hypothetical protein GCM10007417_25630 [Glycocaulis alkaliphilus]|nr:hypothetical protein GCM10007417_25630 [Glycocaulis alkaliphilus]
MHWYGVRAVVSFQKPVRLAASFAGALRVSWSGHHVTVSIGASVDLRANAAMGTNALSEEEE